jgi:hypothetical protein
MTIKAEGKSYDVQPYDVIQIKVTQQDWDDYSTIRDDSDARIAVGMATRHPTMYRVIRGGRKEVICP